MTLPTEDVAALVARLREGLDGVTPGPWNRCGGATPKYTAIHAPGHGYVVFGMADATEDREHKSHGPFIKAPGMVEQHKNAAHIALCSPDNIRALLDHIAAQEAALSTLAGERDGHQSEVLGLMKTLAAYTDRALVAEARATTAEARIAGLEADKSALQDAVNALDQERQGFANLAAAQNGGNRYANAEWTKTLLKLREAQKERDAVIAAGEALSLALSRYGFPMSDEAWRNTGDDAPVNSQASVEARALHRAALAFFREVSGAREDLSRQEGAR